LTDAVEEGVTGLMHPPGDIKKIQNLIEYLYNNKKLMNTFAKQSIERNKLKFSNKLIEQNFINYLLNTII